MKTVGIIASRYGSNRLPGKALKDICGRPMVWWVYQRVMMSHAIDEVYVATDDIRVEGACKQYHIPVIMTSVEHREAANRLQEVSNVIEADFYVQINGDEPMLNPDYIRAAIPDKVPQNEEFGTNLITRMYNPTEVMDSSNIKVIFDCNNYALYFSRAPIPYPFKSIEFSYYKHIGVIGYNKKALDFYKNVEPGRFEKIEGTPLLHFTDYGKKLLCIEVKDSESLSVDSAMDLEYVRCAIKKKIENHELDAYKIMIEKGE